MFKFSLPIVEFFYLFFFVSLIGSDAALGCKPGTYQANEGQGNCSECDPGKMCPSYNMTEPVNCKPGYYCPGGAAQPCPPGTFNNRSGLSLDGACMDCVQGMYCSGYGNENPVGPCDEGFYCQGGAMSKAPNQSHPHYPLNGPCPRGQYCRAGTTSPTDCPIGTFRNSTGAKSQQDCSPCTPGHYCDTPGLKTTSGLCAEGWYCPKGQSVSTPSNFTCFVGHYCKNGTAWPTECEPGRNQCYESLKSVTP